MAIVIFDPAAFKIEFPEFANVPDARLTFFFALAEGILSNKDDSEVKNIARRTLLLNLLVAHIGFLLGALSINGTPAPVGRIKNAQEGSVQAEFEFNAVDSAEWYLQTSYGALYWQLVLSFKSFRYMPRPTCIW